MSAQDEKAFLLDDLAEALQDAWNDFCADTGNFPDCFELRGKRLYADFGRGNFLGMVADRLLAPVPSGEVETPEAAVDAVARAMWDREGDFAAEHEDDREAYYVMARLAVREIRAQGWTPPGTADAK